MDLSIEQWDAIIDVIVDRDLVPFVDLAYQGFADSLDEDAYGVRKLIARVPEMIVTTSCSKNFGLYRERVGALTFISANAEAAGIVSGPAQALGSKNWRRLHKVGLYWIGIIFAVTLVPDVVNYPGDPVYLAIATLMVIALALRIAAFVKGRRQSTEAIDSTR